MLRVNVSWCVASGTRLIPRKRSEIGTVVMVREVKS